MIASPRPLLQPQNVTLPRSDLLPIAHRHGEEARQVLKRYMMMHSVEQLEQECPTRVREHGSLEIDCPDLARRRFAIGFFSCPQQAGNRIHHFLSAMAWAIATNRTLLWKYYDYDTCRQVGEGYDRRICTRTGTRESCEEHLNLAPWIPSYDSWSIVSGKWAEASFWSTHYPPAENETRRKHPWREEDRKQAGIDTDERRLLDFGQLLGQDFRDLWSRQTRNYLLHTKEARNIARQLLGKANIMLGGDYLYGMLFNASFSFSDSLRSTSEPTSHLEEEATFAIHSRHTSTKDDGSIVTREVQCLHNMLLDAQRRPCRVYVMSDRPKAVRRISDAVKEMGCNTTTAKHMKNEIKRSFSLEHGPFAGAGLFHDLAIASQARHGLVGTRRSSTMLLAELIAFGKVTDAIERGDDQPYVFCDYENDCSCTNVVSGDTM